VLILASNNQDVILKNDKPELLSCNPVNNASNSFWEKVDENCLVRWLWAT